MKNVIALLAALVTLAPEVSRADDVTTNATAPAQPRASRGRPNPTNDFFYRLGPDSKPMDGVPHGKFVGPKIIQSDVFPGTQHTYWVYVPAQYDPAKPTRRDDFQRRPGDDGRAGRRAGAKCFGQLDLSPGNTGDAGGLYQSRPATRSTGTEPARTGATGLPTGPTNTIRRRTNTPGSLWTS